jgi:predicted dehydrogenase
MGWRQVEGEGGGALNDLGSHLLDLLTHLVGPLAAVMGHCHTATAHRPQPGGAAKAAVHADDMALMLLKTRDGAVGTAEVSKLATGVHDELRIELHGDRGALRFNLADPNWVEFYDMTRPGSPIGGDQGFTRIQTIGHYPPPAGNMMPGKVNVGWVRSHVASLYNFLGAVCGTETAHPTFSEAAELQRVLDAARRSAEQGVWQTL